MCTKKEHVTWLYCTLIMLHLNNIKKIGTCRLTSTSPPTQNRLKTDCEHCYDHRIRPLIHYKKAPLTSFSFQEQLGAISSPRGKLEATLCWKTPMSLNPNVLHSLLYLLCFSVQCLQNLRCWKSQCQCRACFCLA